ncbi:MAG: helix-turn-helix domain-containing protein [Defluviitaleaceae bacterium]|nr:helix-turn-helix domain-containing protein [Defluviitaleaceae bacterium]
MGERIKYFREKASLTQQGLASLAGTTSQTIGRYEKEKMTPSVEVAQRIANALGVPINTLLHGEQTVKVADRYGELFQDLTKRHEKVADLLSDYGFELFLVGILFELSSMNEDEKVGSKMAIQAILEGKFNLDSFVSLDYVIGCMSEMSEEGMNTVIKYINDMAQIPKYRKQKPPQKQNEDE